MTDEYYIKKALEASEQSTCLRNRVGAVIVKDKEIISSGCNGAPKYQKNCIEIGNCYRNINNIKSATQLERCRAVGSHAESNTISIAAKNGISTANSTIYVVGHNLVCNQCRAIISNSGIVRVVLYKQDKSIEEYIPKKNWDIHPVDIN